MPLSAEQAIQIGRDIALEIDPFIQFPEERSQTMAEDIPSVEEISEEVAECPCVVSLQPMAEWVKVADGGSCRPCTLGPVSNWYYSELKEQGREDLAEHLEKAVDGMDDGVPEQVIKVCEEFDWIKTQADPALRLRLQEFDCSVQAEVAGILPEDEPEEKTETESADENPVQLDSASA